MHRSKILLLPALLLLTASLFAQNPRLDPTLNALFTDKGLTGSFSLLDLQTGQYVVSSDTGLDFPWSPASTFKICNTLIGLQTGVITGRDFTLPWDSVQRSIPAWNRDHDLPSAFSNSVVWYYQEVARRIGPKHMAHWLKKARYGNADSSGGIDQFWLTGGLRITPRQQLDFIRRLYLGKLPFEAQHQALVKDIMLVDQQPDHVLRGKTGWSTMENLNSGWFVGYLEKEGNAWAFVTFVQAAQETPDFGPSRKQITYEALRQLGYLPQ